MIPLPHSTRSRVVSILPATAIFTVPGGLQALVAQRPFMSGLLDGIMIGCGVGLFEAFYVQTQRGRWLRAMHPLQFMAYTVPVVMVVSALAILISRLSLGRADDLPHVYARLRVIIPQFLVMWFIGVSVMLYRPESPRCRAC